MKLTPAQREVLEYFAGDRAEWPKPTMGDVSALVKERLMTHEGWSHFALTDAGRAALKDGAK